MHPSDGKENGGGLQGQKVLKGQFLANERATDWVKGLLPANFFFFRFSFSSLFFLSSPVIYSRRSYFLPDALLSRDNSILHPLCIHICIYIYISPLVVRIRGLTRRANFLPPIRENNINFHSTRIDLLLEIRKRKQSSRESLRIRKSCIDRFIGPSRVHDPRKTRGIQPLCPLSPSPSV